MDDLSNCAASDRAVDQAWAAGKKLSEREKTCLSLIADGLRVQQIASDLAIAEVTVEMHLKNARTKLKARTLAHSVALAIRGGGI